MEQQEKKQNDFIIFLKSILPAAVALGIQLMVQMPPMLIKQFEISLKHQDIIDSELYYLTVTKELSEWMANSGFLDIISMVTMVALCLVFGIWFFISPVSKNMTPVKKALPARNIVIIVIAGFFTQLGISMMLGVILPLFPKLSSSYEQTIESITGGSLAVTLITTVLLAPFAEELIFRGLTLRGTIRHWRNFLLVNTLQALYFGVYHANIIQGTYAFIIGLVFGYVSFRLNNVFASILFHAVVNGSANLMFLPEAFVQNNLIMVFIAIISGLIIWSTLYLLKIPQPEAAPVPNPVIIQERNDFFNNDTNL